MSGWPNFPSQAPNGSPVAVLPLANAGNPVAPPPPAKPMARLRLNTVSDVAKELRKLYREARAGTLATSEASKLAFLLNMLANIMTTGELEARLAALEDLKPGR